MTMQHHIHHLKMYCLFENRGLSNFILVFRGLGKYHIDLSIVCQSQAFFGVYFEFSRCYGCEALFHRNLMDITLLVASIGQSQEVSSFLNPKKSILYEREICFGRTWRIIPRLVSGQDHPHLEAIEKAIWKESHNPILRAFTDHDPPSRSQTFVDKLHHRPILIP